MHCGLLMESQRLPLTVFLIEDRHACVYLMSSALQHSKHGCRSFRIRRLTQNLAVAGDHSIGSQHKGVRHRSFSTFLFRIKDTTYRKLLPHRFRLLR